MNIVSFELDEEEEKRQQAKREEKLKEDEKPIEENEDDCVGCKIQLGGVILSLPSNKPVSLLETPNRY